jgi:hypothetical protein
MKPIKNVTVINKLAFIGIMMLLVFSSPEGLTVAEGAILQQTCNDSDGGLIYDVAGTVDGIGPNGWNYSKSDVCETGAYDGYLKEFFCNGTIAWPKRYQCENGCSDGACLANPTTCTDNDGDTFAVEGGACGLVDCDDADPLVNPGAAEACSNGIDDNCDGLIDDQDPTCLICTDLDGDGYSLEGGACGLTDCDDSDPAVNPGTAEACSNGIDDNCDGLIDTQDPACLICTDLDGDGYSIDGGPCGQVDCDDTDPAINPGAAEDCGNGSDDDCDGLIDSNDPYCSASNLNVIIIGWDGTQWDHLMQCYNQELPECSAGLPNLAALSGDMIYSNVTTSGDSATKPGWAQIMSGYNADVLGIYSNGEYQPIPLGYTVFEKAEDHFGSDNIVTMFISGKGVNTGDACIGDDTTKVGQPAIEDKGQPWCITRNYLDYYENDLRLNSVVGNRALELLDAHQNDQFLALFLFRVPDVYGHVAGEDSVDYSQQIIDNDVWLGNIVAKLNQLGIYDNTLIYVITDHGFDEGSNRHGNAPYGFLASNDPLIMRSGDRKDLAPTILERYGISPGASGSIPAVDGYSLYALPPLACIPEGAAYIDYQNAPFCCTGLSIISLDKRTGPNCIAATGGTGNNSGYCTDCGNGVCELNESRCNCSVDCP